jgi:integrase/recombinase XerD
MNTGSAQSGGTGTGKLEAVKVEELVAGLHQWRLAQGCSERTLKASRQRLNTFWRFLENRGVLENGRVELEAITPALMADYQTYLFDYPNPRTGKKITSCSQANYLCGVRALFQYLKKTKRLAHDPSHVLKQPKARATVPATILTREEMRRLLMAPDTRNPLGFRDRCIMEVLWSTGLRVNELLSLEPADVRFEEGLLLVRHGKGNKQRLIPIGLSALQWLRTYINDVRPVITREALAECRWRPAVISPMLFLSKDATGLKENSLGTRLRRCQRKARIRKRVTVHVFRHTLATEMLKAGADLRHIQELLGHESIDTTQRYLQVAKEELKRVHHASHPREKIPLTPVRYRGENDLS